MHRNGAEDEEKSGGGSTERKRPRSEVGGVAAASTQRAEAVVGEVPWRTLVPTKSGPADQRGGCASKFLVKCRIVGGGPGGAAQGDGGPAKGGDPGAGGEGEGEGEGEAGQAEGEGGGGGGERGGSGDVEVFLVVSDMAREDPQSAAAVLPVPRLEHPEGRAVCGADPRLFDRGERRFALDGTGSCEGQL
ncbi:hypothetical protein Pelo_11268 [Pelomyxa schiedti]|nr:hypothetical protein Pelo_11268 [Pelomyxa schiedti]